MLPPNYVGHAADGVVDIFAEAEAEILADIARRVTKEGYLTPTAKWQLERAQRIGMLQGDVNKILADATNLSQKEIRRLMKEAGFKSLKYDDSIYKAAGLNPKAIEKSPVLQAILFNGVNNTNQLINNFTKTTANMSTSAYTNVLDKTYIKILSGAFDQNTAIKQAINELSHNGINKVAYGEGDAMHYDSLESSVRRAVVTGMNQSVAKLQIARLEEMDWDLVETTSHMDARPTHAIWQGGIFSYHGTSDKYPDFIEVCQYGSGTGICGWNCRHTFFPFFEGLSSSSFGGDVDFYDFEETEEAYEESQKQRYYERQVRNAKKECVVNNAAMMAADEEGNYELADDLYNDFQRASVKLKRREEKLNNFCAETGRSRSREREWKQGFNRSVSSKAVWANRKAMK